MPSLFSRSRTTPNPNKGTLDSPSKTSLRSGLDEFGRIGSPSTHPRNKDPVKKRLALAERSRTFSGATARTDSTAIGQSEVDLSDALSRVPDGSFLPLSLDPPQVPPDLEDALLNGPQNTHTAPEHGYGFLAYERHVVLGLEEAARLVDVVAAELGTRGLTTPFIFSALALDVSAPAVRRLVRSFLETCARPGVADVDMRWREEARFAGPHELGMCLRWGLARMIRVVGGQPVRGLIAWEHYIEFRESEAALNYPPTHFSTFLPALHPTLRGLLLTLLSLLIRFTAHSSSSGHTPPTLSPLFGPLIFGLGPGGLAFHHTYVHYLRAVHAMEHLILAFIRWQDAPRSVTHFAMQGTLQSGGAGAAQRVTMPGLVGIGAAGQLGGQGNHANADSPTSPSGDSSRSLGVPTKLKDWIRGYPAMLPFLPTTSTSSRNPHERPPPRRGARTARVTCIRRNVRMYSPDLVRTSASWAKPIPHASGHDGGEWGHSEAWARIVPPAAGTGGGALQPKYSEAYKKRMDMPPGMQPLTTPFAAPALAAMSSAHSGATSGSASSSLFDGESGGVGREREGREGEDRYRNLTDLRWGEFEAMGFAEPDEKKLQFDLTESARQERAAKRATLNWTDFSADGFSRTDATLSATLQFSPPVASSIAAWPAQSSELQRKLRKAHRALPPFGWDTTPVQGAPEEVEEAFLDVFCDLVYGGGPGVGPGQGSSAERGVGGLAGGGWMEVGRGEEVERECNWALVEFRALPLSASPSGTGSDHRSSTSLVLFEEFVPLEYRQQLAKESTGKRKKSPFAFLSPGALASLTGKRSGGQKEWKPAATLNGRPYVIGHVPKSPTFREVEFEGMLRGTGGSVTKVISLSASGTPKNPNASATNGPFSRSRDVIQPSPANASIGHDRTPVASNLYVEPPRAQTSMGHIQQTEIPLERQFSEPQMQNSPLTPGGGRNKRFRLPLPMPHGASPMAMTRSVSIGKRGSGVPTDWKPAGATPVEFETRLASYSDDELVASPQPGALMNPEEKERERVRQEKRMSRDDAWVDILVASHTRRMGGQEAELRPRGSGQGEREARRRGLKGGRSDPELASMELERVLAGVRAGSPFSGDDEPEPFNPYPEGDEEDVDRRMSSTTYPTIVDLPRPSGESMTTSEAAAGAQQEDPDVDSVMSFPNSGSKKLGYFDLHPERRPGGARPMPGGARTMSNASEYSISEISAAGAGMGRRSQDSDTPTVGGLPDFADEDAGGAREKAHARAESTTLPGLVAPPAAPEKRSVSPGTDAKSKTASLIEMYRERERSGSSPSGTAAPSKLPVRSSSLAKDKAIPPLPPSASSTPSPKPATTTQGSISLHPNHSHAPEASEGDMESVTSSELEAADVDTHAEGMSPPDREALFGVDGVGMGGRASPIRYVHGLPLHNVLEEEEDDA
ncbi:hypothetical protein CONPUDRAFT_92063 [Coniophora puteana RWD-64-598 SS2]|uniref:Meiotically up-regulated protein Msb1/Mug8 domain-containing protein n=1 Tax=Coniophora puteana (strain RWD-64-598) TaxID=741705 RepID=A0A5M3MG26_CONPW|nr:uncharacterized protein CONPUDRAFT_92063 [Coniophora puteana RWD-64-598 SS2]EIW77551.1 hypothetical protein CONPUDRAFT_92063 [Coniophora puteana RWD-64-598 SS2]